jgi:hypothetical protein
MYKGVLFLVYKVYNRFSNIIKYIKKQSINIIIILKA